MVLLGERNVWLVAQILMVAFYPIVPGGRGRLIGPWVALKVLGIPRLVQVLRSSPCAAGVTAAQLCRLAAVVRRAGVVHTRRAGALLILGLLNAFLPVKLPWL